MARPSRHVPDFGASTFLLISAFLALGRTQKKWRRSCPCKTWTALNFLPSSSFRVWQHYKTKEPKLQVECVDKNYPRSVNNCHRFILVSSSSHHDNVSQQEHQIVARKGHPKLDWDYRKYKGEEEVAPLPTSSFFPCRELHFHRVQIRHLQFSSWQPCLLFSVLITTIPLIHWLEAKWASSAHGPT